MTNKFKKLRYKKKEKECDKKTTSYLEQQSRHFCQHLMRRTTQQTFLAINWASQQKTTKLHFSSQVRKEFKLLTVPFKPLRRCLRSDNLIELPCLKILQTSIFKLSRDLNRQLNRTFLNGFLSDYGEITSGVYTKTIILFNIGE